MKKQFENKNVTIYDVAKLANTSPSTASRVLGKSDYKVSSTLKQRVEEAAEKLNYIPNAIGRQLKKNINTNIGVIIPSITNSFYSLLVLGIEEIARKSGNHVFLCNSYRSPELEKEYLHSLYEKQVKGIIISSISNKYDIFTDLKKRGVSFVAFDQKMEGFNCSQILFDFEKAGYMATKYLLDKGHKKIAYVSAPINRYSRKCLLNGFKKAMDENNIYLPKEYIQISEIEYEFVEQSYEFENGRKLTEILMNLDDSPTAIVACNDMTAFGVYNQLNYLGLEVPNDVSVIGIDNIEMSSMISPGLTTVQQPNYEMGKLACKLLVDILNNGNQDLEITMQPKIIERESVRNITN